MSIEITDNSKEVSAAIEAAILRGLEKCGLVAEGYAKKLCPVDTGNLRNSITHVVDEQEPAAIIGTDNEMPLMLSLAPAFTPRAAADGLHRGCIRTQRATGITRAATRQSRT